MGSKSSLVSNLNNDLDNQLNNDYGLEPGFLQSFDTQKVSDKIKLNLEKLTLKLENNNLLSSDQIVEKTIIFGKSAPEMIKSMFLNKISLNKSKNTTEVLTNFEVLKTTNLFNTKHLSKVFDKDFLEKEIPCFNTIQCSLKCPIYLQNVDNSCIDIINKYCVFCYSKQNENLTFFGFHKDEIFINFDQIAILLYFLYIYDKVVYVIDSKINENLYFINYLISNSIISQNMIKQKKLYI